jgi:hypothetical protein
MARAFPFSTGNSRQKKRTKQMQQKGACFWLVQIVFISTIVLATVARSSNLRENVLRNLNVVKRWDPAKCVVIGLAVGYSLEVFETFVGSLRATGYPGHIILGIAVNTDQQTRDYLAKHGVTVKEVPSAEQCSYNYTSNPFQEPPKCAKDYPDYKIQWGRFPLAADWLRECKDCTDGVMLTDTRDAYFQADPSRPS